MPSFTTTLKFLFTICYFFIGKNFLFLQIYTFLFKHINLVLFRQQRHLRAVGKGRSTRYRMRFDSQHTGINQQGEHYPLRLWIVHDVPEFTGSSFCSPIALWNNTILFRNL